MIAPHRHEVRVYYEDTDFSGNVYHAAYLKFLERGRTEFLRDLGLHHHQLMASGLAFAVRAMEISFDTAAHIDDLLTVTTEVSSLSGVRLGLVQTIARGPLTVTRANLTIVTIRLGGGVARLPQALRDAVGGVAACSTSHLRE